MTQHALGPSSQPALACPFHGMLPPVPAPLLLTSPLTHTCPVQRTTVFHIHSIFIGTVLQRATKGSGTGRDVTFSIPYPLLGHQLPCDHGEGWEDHGFGQLLGKPNPFLADDRQP